MEAITAGEAPVLNLAAIKPDASGKYSPLLYKWLTHKSRKPWHFQNVFQCHDRIEGGGVYTEHWRSRELIIGHGEFREDGTILGIGGRTVGDIICGVRGSLTEGFYYGPAFGLRDITAEFWATYQRIGRCAWDHSHTLHMIGDESRWHYIAGGRQRECQWCGRVFEAITTMVPVIEFKERTDWSEYAASATSTLLHPMGSMGEEVAA